MELLTFIIIHHSTSDFHKDLLKLCIESLRRIYNHNKIIICKTSTSFIDDKLINKDNIEIINTPLDGSHVYGGIYLILKRPDINNYILMHDSMILTKKLPNDILNKKFYYLWHFDCAQFDNSNEVIKLIANNEILNSSDKILILNNYINKFQKEWVGLFGPAFGGNRETLKILCNKINLHNISISMFTGRDNLLAAERYIAIIANYFHLIDNFENSYSLNGNIQNQIGAFNKLNDINQIKYLIENNNNYFIKIWVGRD